MRIGSFWLMTLALAGLSSRAEAAQIGVDTIGVKVREEAVAAADAAPAIPFFLLGAAGGFYVGSALGDIGRIRQGEESDYRLRRVVIGGSLLVGGAVASRELGPKYTYTGPPGYESLAHNTYESRLHARRRTRFLSGAVVGALIGWAVYAFAPGGT